MTNNKFKLLFLKKKKEKKKKQESDLCFLDMHDTPDDFGLLDDSTLDTDKSSFSYRFSRKFDAKSDENSENSKSENQPL